MIDLIIIWTFGPSLVFLVIWGSLRVDGFDQAFALTCGLASALLVFPAIVCLAAWLEITFTSAPPPETAFEFSLMGMSIFAKGIYSLTHLAFILILAYLFTKGTWDESREQYKSYHELVSKPGPIVNEAIRRLKAGDFEHEVRPYSFEQDFIFKDNSKLADLSESDMDEIQKELDEIAALQSTDPNKYWSAEVQDRERFLYVARINERNERIELTIENRIRVKITELYFYGSDHTTKKVPLSLLHRYRLRRLAWKALGRLEEPHREG